MNATGVERISGAADVAFSLPRQLCVWKYICVAVQLNTCCRPSLSREITDGMSIKSELLLVSGAVLARFVSPLSVNKGRVWRWVESIC